MKGRAHFGVLHGRETAKPKDVPARMKALLDGYNSKSDIAINDTITFHAEFEQIHPFQDGNGRVGRLIALKECLRHHIIPFLIEDRKKRITIGDCPNGMRKRAGSRTPVWMGRTRFGDYLRCLKLTPTGLTHDIKTADTDGVLPCLCQL